MTTVRIACVQPYLDTTSDGSTAIRHILVVLATSPGTGRWGCGCAPAKAWQCGGSWTGRPATAAAKAGAKAGELPVREFTTEGLAIRLLGRPARR